MKALSKMKKSELAEEVIRLDAVVGLLTAICSLHGEEFPKVIDDWARSEKIKGETAKDLIREVMERKV